MSDLQAPNLSQNSCPAQTAPRRSGDLFADLSPSPERAALRISYGTMNDDEDDAVIPQPTCVTLAATALPSCPKATLSCVSTGGTTKSLCSYPGCKYGPGMVLKACYHCNERWSHHLCQVTQEGILQTEFTVRLCYECLYTASGRTLLDDLMPNVDEAVPSTAVPIISVSPVVQPSSTPSPGETMTKNVDMQFNVQDHLLQENGGQRHVAEPTSAMGPTWYSNGEEQPDLSSCTSLQGARTEIQQWALFHGFKAIQLRCDAGVKATFVCRCKGRKTRSQGNETLHPEQRRRVGHEHALPGEAVCPFK